MRILFISNELIAGNLALLLKKEGCDVRIFIRDKDQKSNLANFIDKTKNWSRDIKWVGKDGLIIFDDIGYGSMQEKLRKEGYSVFGGSKLGDKLEDDREWAQKIFRKFGLKTLPTKNFRSIESAIRFLRKNEGPWVVKQNGYAPDDANYVSDFSDNRDLISVLQNYMKNYKSKLGIITLQKRVYGVEIGVGRYFNGNDWVGPIEINVEHKKLFPGNWGPNTSEMGTLAWYDDDEENKLFLETLNKLKPFLQKIDFRGDIDVGCIANESGIYVLEATPRLGTPIIHLHSEIHLSRWSDFLFAIARGESFELKWRKGVGVVVLIASPPFPLECSAITPVGLKVSFDKSMTDNDFSHIHLEGISINNKKDKSPEYYITDPKGYLLYVTAMAKNARGCWKKINKIIGKINIPKMFFRNDIGLQFDAVEHEKLVRWGYLK